ncbi:MAG: alpha/beta hydrolase [Eubacteriales bacterium]|nr:alpha/beta hydrolase [Eubacteriales bacterium]
MAKTELIKLKFQDGEPFANSQYYKYGDYDLHYRIDPAKGTEKAKMFMIHGFGCDTTFFDELVERYTKEGIKCVRVDLPDFGYSTREDKNIHFVPQIPMLYDLMDKLDTDKSGWILVGHSMGGSVALEMANQDFSRFNAIILNAPLLMFNVPPWLSKFIMIKPMCDIMDKALAFFGPHDWLFKVIEFTMTMDPIYSLKYDAKKFEMPYIIEGSGTGLCYMTSKTTCPSLDELHKITVPLQLVTGTADLFVFPTKSAALRAALPAGFDDHKIQRGGHCFLQNRDKETAKLALDFLKKNGLL